MFFIYSDTNLINRCDPQVVAEMNRLRRAAEVPGIYGDYNGTVSALAVYLAMVSRPWDQARMSLKEAMSLMDNYPEFTCLCAAITQNDLTVATLLSLDNYTVMAQVPPGGWKIKIPSERVERVVHVCETKGYKVPDNIRLNNWEQVFTRPVNSERLLIVTPIKYGIDKDIPYVQNGVTV